MAKEQIEYSEILIGQEKIICEIHRKKIKNMYMKISRETGNLIITTTKNVSNQVVDAFIRSKINWIIKQRKILSNSEKLKESGKIITGNKIYFLGKRYTISIFPSTQNKMSIQDDLIQIYIKEKYVLNQEYIRKYYEKWIKEECLRFCTEYVKIYYEKMKKYGIPFPKINIKKFKSRWGCCIPKKQTVEFAMSLVKAPKECVEYVVVHELAHFKFIHHDDKFYNFVSIFIPDWKERRKRLNKEYGIVIEY